MIKGILNTAIVLGVIAVTALALMEIIQVPLQAGILMLLVCIREVLKYFKVV